VPRQSLPEVCLRRMSEVGSQLLTMQSACCAAVSRPCIFHDVKAPLTLGISSVLILTTDAAANNCNCTRPPNEQRVTYKLCLLVLCSLITGRAPAYLVNLLTIPLRTFPHERLNARDSTATRDVPAARLVLGERLVSVFWP
jgi:hypothetical protein